MASGIIAAVANKKEGKSVFIIEPGRWVGGILGAGIKPRQDCPNIQVSDDFEQMFNPHYEMLGMAAVKSVFKRWVPEWMQLIEFQTYVEE